MGLTNVERKRDEIIGKAEKYSPLNELLEELHDVGGMGDTRLKFFYGEHVNNGSCPHINSWGDLREYVIDEKMAREGSYIDSVTKTAKYGLVPTNTAKKACNKLFS